MESIRQIGFLLCILGLGAAIVSYLLPQNAVSAVVKAAAGVVFCVIFCRALQQGDFTFDFDFAQYAQTRSEQLANAAAKQTLTLTENAVSDTLYGELRKLGYAVKRVQVSLHILSDNSIRIDSIVIDADGDVVPIGEYVQKEYGVTPTIIVDGEG